MLTHSFQQLPLSSLVVWVNLSPSHMTETSMTDLHHTTEEDSGKLLKTTGKFSNIRFIHRTNFRMLLLHDADALDYTTFY